MKDKKELIEVVFMYVKNYFNSDEEKSPEMVAAISELIKSLD